MVSPEFAVTENWYYVPRIKMSNSDSQFLRGVPLKDA